MMRRFYAAVIFLTLMAGGTMGLRAGEYRLTNGDIVRGEPASFNEDGVVVRLDIGGFSPRLSWSKLTQESLKELARNPQAARLAEPFIEIPLEEREAEKRKKREIVLTPVPRLEPLEKTPFLKSFGTTGGMVILLVLYAANLFAGYEISKFRNRSRVLGILAAAIFPVAGPAILLMTPTGVVYEEEAEPSGAGEPAAAPAAASGKKVTGAQAPAGGGLGLAGGGKTEAAPASLDGAVFKRGETTFNRRFFETKFPGFFRVVPSEAERDLVLVVRAGRNDYVAKRVSRISATELHLQLLQGNEVMVPFGEVVEVRVRHKDAKG